MNTVRHHEGLDSTEYLHQEKYNFIIIPFIMIGVHRHSPSNGKSIRQDFYLALPRDTIKRKSGEKRWKYPMYAFANLILVFASAFLFQRFLHS